MIRYRYENMFDYLQQAPKHIEVTEINAEWFIDQILRDIELSKINAETVIRDHRMDWTMPELLKNKELELGPSTTEAIMFRIIMNEFSHLIFERKKKQEVEKYYNSSSAKVAFVNSIINTRIKIENRIVKLFTYNENLSEKIREAVEKEGFKLEVVNKVEDMRFYT